MCIKLLLKKAYPRADPGKVWVVFLNPLVMYQEFVVCNVPRNCITNVENSTIFYFKSVSTWQEDLLHIQEAHKDSGDMTNAPS